MRPFLMCFTALIAAGLAVAPAEATWPCPCLPTVVPIRLEYRTVTKYCTEYRTEFKEVQRTIKHLVVEQHLEKVIVDLPSVRYEKKVTTVKVPGRMVETYTSLICGTTWQTSRDRPVQGSQ